MNSRTLNTAEKRGPLVFILALVPLAALALRSQGRLWRCACGRVLLWSGDVWSADNSQHLLDPYSLTHVLHGFIFWGLAALFLKKLSRAWRFALAVAAESLWEVVENSAYVIDRYREATAALGYQGDTIINSLGDIAMCGLGFWAADRLGWRRTALLFVAIEVVLLFWIRDNLTLNLIMLIHPVEAIKQWQMMRG